MDGSLDDELHSLDFAEPELSALASTR